MMDGCCVRVLSPCFAAPALPCTCSKVWVDPAPTHPSPLDPTLHRPTLHHHCLPLPPCLSPPSSLLPNAFTTPFLYPCCVGAGQGTPDAWPLHASLPRLRRHTSQGGGSQQQPMHFQAALLASFVVQDLKFNGQLVKVRGLADSQTLDYSADERTPTLSSFTDNYLFFDKGRIGAWGWVGWHLGVWSAHKCTGATPVDVVGVFCTALVVVLWLWCFGCGALAGQLWLGTNSCHLQ